jgi:hypothetical protein
MVMVSQTATVTCWKVSFPTEDSAWRRLFEIAFERDRGHPKPARPYWCGRCFAWHLTRRMQ